MKHYRTFKIVAVFWALAFPAFIWFVFLKSDPEVKPVVNVEPVAASKRPAESVNPPMDTLTRSVDITEETPALTSPGEALLAEVLKLGPAEETSLPAESASLYAATEEVSTADYTAADNGLSVPSSITPSTTTSRTASASQPAASGSSSSTGDSGGSSSTGDSGTSSENDSGTETDSSPINSDPADSTIPGGMGSVPTIDTYEKALPNWIMQEGIRGGFMSSTGDNLAKIPGLLEAVKNIRLNTVIVYGSSFAEDPKHLSRYREWIRLCHKVGLRVFVFYGWQPPVGNTCRSVVFADGTEGLFPCPLDYKLWDNYLMADMAEKLANLSMESPESSFDGYFLDMEMYRTENLPPEKKTYSLDTCFCDSCFSNFIIDCTQFKDLPLVRKDRRKLWLQQNGYLSDYYVYLESQVQIRAEELRLRAHMINPELLFGVYPAITDKNWVLQSVMRGFGKNSYPVISFSSDTYGYYLKPWGADRIPQDIPAYFEKYDINGVYAAGYLLRKYTSSEIGRNLIKSCQNAQGYWLFRMPQLLEEDIPEDEPLAGGTPADYLQAIKNANITLGTK